MANGLPKIFASGIFDTSVRLDFRMRNTDIPTTLRTVKEYEIEFFCENGGVSFINGTENPIKKGCILVASPGDKRQSLLHFKAMFIHFAANNERLEELISSLPRFIRDCNYEKYHKLFSRVCDRAPDFDDYSDIADSGRLIELLYSLRKDCAVDIFADTKTENTQSAILSAVEYIKKHYFEPINVDTLAQMCHLSTSYFYRIFTQVADLTPNEFIIQTRLKAAQTMLVSSDASMVEVVERCGFNSQSYFCYSFKKNFGVTPNEFRKNHRYPID